MKNETRPQVWADCLARLGWGCWVPPGWGGRPPGPLFVDKHPPCAAPSRPSLLFLVASQGPCGARTSATMASREGRGSTLAAEADTTKLWRPQEKGEGEGVDPEDMFYFIDSNKAYRGPVDKHTLHHLFANGLITEKTYLFAEHLGAGHAWTRIKKLPDLLAELSQPVSEPDADGADDAGAAEATAPAASGSGGASSSAESDESPPVLEQRRSSSIVDEMRLSEVAPMVPDAPVIATTGRMNVTLVLPADSSKKAADSTKEGGGLVGSHTRQQEGGGGSGGGTGEQQQQQQVKAAASPPPMSFPGMASAGHDKLYPEWCTHPFPKPKPPSFMKRLFGGGRSATNPNRFGTPLGKLPLGGDGTPCVLARFRERLWAIDGEPGPRARLELLASHPPPPIAAASPLLLLPLLSLPFSLPLSGRPAVRDAALGLLVQHASQTATTPATPLAP
jgi:hypothetical protein